MGRRSTPACARQCCCSSCSHRLLRDIHMRCPRSPGTRRPASPQRTKQGKARHCRSLPTSSGATRSTRRTRAWRNGPAHRLRIRTRRWPMPCSPYRRSVRSPGTRDCAALSARRTPALPHRPVHSIPRPRIRSRAVRRCASPERNLRRSRLRRTHRSARRASALLHRPVRSQSPCKPWRRAKAEAHRRQSTPLRVTRRLLTWICDVESTCSRQSNTRAFQIWACSAGTVRLRSDFACQIVPIGPAATCTSRPKTKAWK